MSSIDGEDFESEFARLLAALGRGPLLLVSLICLAICIVMASGCKPESTELSFPKQTITSTDATSNSPSQNDAKRVLSARPWFTEVTTQAGIDFIHNSGLSPEKPFPAANGSGLASFDFDLDGFQDLYFATGTGFPVDLTQHKSINRMYQNVGAIRFRDVTQATRLGHNGYSAGLATADFDNDGFSDVYVVCYGANRLFHNLGDGTFERVEAVAAVDDDQWGTSAAFFDFDQDGNLDLYVCNYGVWSLETNGWCGDRVRNLRFFCNPLTLTPARDVFYLSTGEGKFKNVTDELRIEPRPGRGQGVVAADLNGDGWTDLYVANDLDPNRVLENDGGRKFRDLTETSGAGYDAQGVAQAGMGVDVGDVNGDGLIDVFVTNYSNEYNTLYQNMSHGSFQDFSNAIGLGPSSMPWIGWGTALADFDLDGWLDVAVTNGHVDNNRHLIGSDSVYEHPPLLFRNRNGKLELLEADGGDYFLEQHCGRGLATSDLDNDGDLDLIIGHQDNQPAILRNERTKYSPTPTWIGLHLLGTSANRTSIGGVVRVQCGDRVQTYPIKGGGSYLSASDVRQVIAVPDSTAEISVEIQWPGGDPLRLGNVETGRYHTVVQPRTVNNL